VAGAPRRRPPSSSPGAAPAPAPAAAPAPPDPAQRLRLARLGAAVLALYSRTSLTRKAAPARR
jgi:hypothetical protein